MKMLLRVFTALSLLNAQSTFAGQAEKDPMRAAELTLAKFKTNNDVLSYMKKLIPEAEVKDLEAFVKGRMNPTDKPFAVKVKKDVITIDAKGTLINLTVVDSSRSLYTVGGVELDLNPDRPIGERLTSLEALLKRQYGPKTSWLDALFPKAHAFGPGEVLIGIAAVIAVFGVAVVMAVRDHENSNYLWNVQSNVNDAVNYCLALEGKADGPAPDKKEPWVQSTMNRFNHTYAEHCGGIVHRTASRVSFTYLSGGTSFGRVCDAFDNLKTCFANLIKRNVQLTQEENNFLAKKLQQIYASPATGFERYVHPEPKPAAGQAAK